MALRHPQSRCFAVAMNDNQGCYRYPEAVRFEIEEQNQDVLPSRRRLPEHQRRGLVSIQHEFGIFGGPAGSHLLTLLRELTAPVVTTLHTVLLKPNADQYRVMQELIAHSTRLVVMTERGRTILQEVYEAPSARSTSSRTGFPT